ncbi:unnamed protein product [Bemisia tabaci]|uniref:Peptidase S1 domain-containing protein n=1 Tax=Bemisia tabaci TaxID=7038 RepID=A0A9P0A7G9_BEMTA|nr:unnamed protein product [Bemisia tabaci]
MIYATSQGHATPHLQTCIFLLITLPVTIKAIFHPESPCPTVFNYEGREPEFDRWYGEVQLVSNDNLVGVVLNINFDRATHLLVSWTGEVTTEDNMKYTILDLNQRLVAKVPVLSRLMVKFNGTKGSPRIKTIRLNGRQICPPEDPVVNELQQKPRVTTDKNNRVVTKRPDPNFPDTYPTPSYYDKDFMPPSTPRHRTTTTEKYIDVEESPYNQKPPYQSSSNSGNKNKDVATANSHDNYDSGYRPSNNQGVETDKAYSRPSSGNYVPPKNPSYEVSNTNKNKPSHFAGEDETSYASNVDRPVGPSGSKNPYSQQSNINYNQQSSASNSGSYNSQNGGNSASNGRPTNKKPVNHGGYSDVDEVNSYNSGSQSSVNSNKKPFMTTNLNNFNEGSNYNNQGGQSSYAEENSRPTSVSTGSKKPAGSSEGYDGDHGYSAASHSSVTSNKKPSSTSNNKNYNKGNSYNNQGGQLNHPEDEPRPTSINTGNKKPSGNDYNNFEGDNGYPSSNSQSNYNANKPKQPVNHNTESNGGHPSGSSVVNPSRPTHIEHIPTSSSSQVGSNNNNYNNGASNNFNSGSNSGYNGEGASGYNGGASNNNYNTGTNGYNSGNNNNFNAGMAQPYQPSNTGNNNYPAGIDKTDSLNLGDVQPAKSEKTVIITSIHKNTYVVPAGNKKDEELGYNSNSPNENSYNGNSNLNSVTTPKYDEFNPGSKPSVIMKPSGQNSNKPSNGNSGGSGKKPAQNSKPQSNSNKDEPCGVISAEAANLVTPLVTYGQTTARGQWPWHVALYKTDGINLTYICGGSLIAKNIVVTAAHCVTKKPLDRPVDANTIVIYLGKYHLQQYSDDGGIQIKQVLEIVPFTTYNSSNYLGDIALLKMTSNIEYTSFVRPVCMWDPRVSELSSVIDKEGTVIGWGYDEHDKASEELKMAKMPVVSQETCIYSNRPFFSQFTSNKTFCAGFRNGTSVCNGDSGGGMVFPRGNTWHLRGIVSISVAHSGLRKCDTKHYIVFTDVAKYLDWINNYVQKHRS